jgi:hypothetical protein
MQGPKKWMKLDVNSSTDISSRYLLHLMLVASTIYGFEFTGDCQIKARGFSGYKTRV